MPTLAALPPYDLPETRDAMDAWWRGLAGHLERAGVADVPAALTRGDDPWALWQAPDLLLAQTCGYPLVTRLEGVVRALATPCYGTVFCDGPLYASLLMVRQDDPAETVADFAGRRAAINDRLSHSGYNVLRATVAPLAADGRFFADVVETGAHRSSLAAVRDGRADIAAIDGVTLALVARHAPGELDGTRILGRTAMAPGLPYVTRADADEDARQRLLQGLMAAAADPALAGAREALLLTGFVAADDGDYRVMSEMAAAAADQGLADLP